MKKGRKPILKRNTEEWDRLKHKINYGIAEHIEHSCTFCYNQIIYDDIDYCDATEKWFAIDTLGVCELWKRTPRPGDFKK
jgi:hypothetical protein